MIRSLFVLILLASIGFVTAAWADDAATTAPATVDVTAKVKALAKDNQLTLAPDADVLGAVAGVEADKRLKVDYTVGGKSHVVTAEQGHTLNLPCDADGAGELVIVKAAWGLPAAIAPISADVTEKVKAGVKDNSLTISAANESFGVDPCVGLTKELKVEYTVDGKSHTAKASESEDLTLPAKDDGTGPLVIVKATWEMNPVQAQ